MRRALLALLLLCPALALSYTFSQPQCWPVQIGGVGQGFQTWDPQDGTGICRFGWWCPKPDGTWESYTHCTIAKYKDASWQLYWSQASKLPAQQAAGALIQALQVAPANQTEISALDSLMVRFAGVMQATKPADVVVSPPPPPAPAWAVDSPTSSDGTRPAYPFANGVRGTTSTGRAASGRPCRPDIAASPYGAAGSQTQQYAAFGPAFAANLVALCRKQ